jgi:hypothetical protein
MIKYIGVLLLIGITCNEVHAQQNQKWFLETAIRFTGDAEMFFIGPSVGLGVGKHVGKNWSFSTSYTWFSRQVDEADGYYDKYRTHTIDVTSNYMLRNIFNPNRGFYVGGGIGVQARKEVCFAFEHFSDTPDGIMEINETFVVGVLNTGYQFPILMKGKLRSLAIDLKATGPYTIDYTESVTQLMLGIRFRY